MEQKVRVLLAEDHRMFREALRYMLAREPDIQIVGEVGDGMELLACASDAAPDVVCMDVSMPRMTGIEATRRLLAANPAIKVIGLSAYTDKHFVVDMLDAGAVGYVTKEEAGEELLRAIRATRSGHRHLCPSVAAMVAEALLDPQAGNAPSSRLSARERQVLQLIAEGNTSPQIAHHLSLAPSTVEVHRRNIMRKLNLHSVADLTRYAIRNGLATN